MTTRPGRSSSIPIPRPSSSAIPGRNIGSILSTPLAASNINRWSSGSQMVPSSSADDFMGIAGTRPLSSRSTGSTVRHTLRSYIQTPGHTSNPSRAPSIYEPRIIRADTSRSIDPTCLPSGSVSPLRARTSSAATLRIAPIVPPRPPVGLSISHPATYISFPRPAYLDHSSLRLLLQTEAPNELPSLQRSIETHPFNPRARMSLSPSLDSDEESNFSPPRELHPPIHPILLPKDPVFTLPSRWNESRHPSLSISEDGRELSCHGPNCNGDKDAAAARTTHPVPPACGIYYYEVEILNKGQKGHISIGFASGEVRLSRLPGWEKNSWGYHGDDGICFAGERNGTQYGPKFETGDIIGCGIDFTINRMFFTRNGTHLGLVFENVGRDCEIYPSVGLRHTSESVRVNFGQQPFKFDIEYYVLGQRNQIWNKIMATTLPSSWISTKGTSAVNSSSAKASASDEQIRATINELVLGYLDHHGYAKTARAFQSQCSRQGSLGFPSTSKTLPVLLSAASTLEDVDMDDALHSSVSAALHSDGDIDTRMRVMSCITSGDATSAMALMEAHFPEALRDDQGFILCKLRCQRFVELILEGANLKKRMAVGEETTEEETTELSTPLLEVEEKEAPRSVAASERMDIDDTTYPVRTNGFGVESVTSIAKGKQKQSSLSPGPTPTSLYENALNRAIQYGQSLQKDFRHDKRPEVQAIFRRTFGIVAWADPSEAGGEAAEVVGQGARVQLAAEVNQAILQSRGRPAHPTLETLYRQTEASIVQLGMMGVGAAAYADLSKELFES